MPMVEARLFTKEHESIIALLVLEQEITNNDRSKEVSTLKKKLLMQHSPVVPMKIKLLNNKLGLWE
jgi:hypothetical protein